MDGTELPCKREIGNTHDPFTQLPVLACFLNASITLAFTDDTAEDGILLLKDPLGLGNSSFSLTRQKYFKIDIVPKTMVKPTYGCTIFSQ